MRPFNVDSTIKKAELLSARAAAQLLGVKLQTLYAYASRGLVAGVRSPDGRGRYYARDDIERLKARHDARSGHAPVAAGALRWGDPVLDSSVTSIDERGPRYRGILAVELAEAAFPFESVAELLWTGELPPSPPAYAPAQLDRRALFALLPPAPPPLSVLPLLTAALGARSNPPGPAGREVEMARARVLLATMASTLSALPSRAEGPVARVLLASLGARQDEEAAAAVDLALVLVADHELTVSSFAARVAASAGADLHACVGAALAAVSGSRHGGVCDRIEALVRDLPGPDQMSAFIAAREASGESLPGFGHPLYPGGDPRAVPLLALAARLAPERPRVQALLAFARAMGEQRDRLPTIDLGLVALAEALGARPFAASTLFAIGRVAGWVAHVLEQREAGFLLRPRARYVGAAPRPPGAVLDPRPEVRDD